MRFSLVGPGRVGMALAHALLAAGYELIGVVARRPESARQAVDLLGAGVALAAPAEALPGSEAVLIATPDDQIAAVVRSLAEGRAPLAGRLVCHTSGATSLDVLAPLAERGARVGSIHPLQTFARRWPPQALAGCAFAVEAEGAAAEACFALVAAVGGWPLPLLPGRKAEYHAAASLASNHLLGLLDVALTLLQQAGLEREQGWRALLPLVQRTLDNAEAGVEAALTGPIERGDIGTVRAHLAALRRLAASDGGRALAVYRSLGLVTLAVARRKHREPERQRVWGELERELAAMGANPAGAGGQHGRETRAHVGSHRNEASRP